MSLLSKAREIYGKEPYFSLINFVVITSVILGTYTGGDWQIQERTRDARTQLIMHLYDFRPRTTTHHFFSTHNVTPIEIYLSRMTRSKAYFYYEPSIKTYRFTYKGRYTSYLIAECVRNLNGTWYFKNSSCSHSID